jgi:SSS family solute:Na+ symporter
LVIFTLLFAVVTYLGFYAARWRGSSSRDHLDDWGLGGRKFGTSDTWFLLGGDIFTAYTFVAVPALMFGAGPTGFFALPYVVLVYPLVFLPLARMWSVSRRHRYVTPADFVRGRYGSDKLALLIAVTGIVATMPYIAVQLVGLEAVLRTMGLNGAGLVGHAPVFVAFVILAAYTYRSGLRAPALISVVKAGLIILVIIVAVIILTRQLGGWDSIFDAANKKFNVMSSGSGILLGANNQLQYVTLALSSALALFLYPHALTGVLASGDRKVIKRNMVLLPVFTFVLGAYALLGYAAIAAHTEPIVNRATDRLDYNTVVPRLFEDQFPPWFTGIAFAAIGIGALVPASIMSIAAANLWSRNIYKAYWRRGATNEEETQQAKFATLVVKLGAVMFIVFIDPKYTLYLQLIGGVFILQTLPAVAIALYTRWFHRWGLVAGWAVGLAWGLWMLYSIPDLTTGAVLGDPGLELGRLSILGWEPLVGSKIQIYPGFVALLGNLLVAAVGTIVLRRCGVCEGTDETKSVDYHFDGSVSELNQGNVLGARRATATLSDRARNG